MWIAISNPVPGDEGVRFVARRDGEDLTYAEVIHAWRNDAAFRAWFTGVLIDAGYEAFRWETPAVTSATANRPFECVVLHAPRLARRPDAESFAEHFQREPGAEVVTFPSLGRDAILIAPCPRGPHADYVHLGVFLREAPASQIDALWRAVGDAMQRRLGERPVWLSTAGGGVAWLHVRLDDRPKYYHYAPYRTPPRNESP
jgi:hypothetical protein